jgi:hypothetical protein
MNWDRDNSTVLVFHSDMAAFLSHDIESSFFERSDQLFSAQASAASRHNFRVDRSEFTACVIDFHLPIDPALGLVNIG